MSPMTTTEEKTGPGEWNGHFFEKGFGNTLFEGPLRNLPYPETPLDLDAAIRAMYTDGYVIFPQVLDAAGVARLRALIDGMGGDDAQYYFKDWCYNKHIGSDYTHDVDLLEYIDKPGIIDVAEAIHKGFGGGCHVTGGTAWVTGAGRAMGMHVDYLPVHLPEEVHDDPRVRVPIFTSTAHYYLDDLVPELGPTLLVPGSHRAGRPPDNETSWRGIEPQAAMVRAGDVVLFRGDLWHGAWKNTAPERRRYILQVHYANAYIGKGYPSMRLTSLYAPSVLERATPRQRALLGGS